MKNPMDGRSETSKKLQESGKSRTKKNKCNAMCAIKLYCGKITVHYFDDDCQNA